MNRRDVVKLGGAVAFIGGSLGQVAAQLEPRDTDAEIYGIIVGTDRPSPQRISSEWDQYRFVWIDAHTGDRATISDTDGGWTPLALTLRNYAVGGLPTDIPEGYLAYDTNRGLPAWWDGDSYEWPNFVDDVLISPVTVANTTTRTIVWEPDINANSLVEGRIYQIDLHGIFSTANTSDTFTVDVNIAGVDAAELQNAQQNATDAPWTLEITFTVRSHGVNGIIKPNTRATFDEQPRTARHGEISVDTTAATNLAVAIDWSAADPANSVTLEQAHLKQMG